MDYLEGGVGGVGVCAGGGERQRGQVGEKTHLVARIGVPDEQVGALEDARGGQLRLMFCVRAFGDVDVDLSGGCRGHFVVFGGEQNGFGGCMRL